MQTRRAALAFVATLAAAGVANAQQTPPPGSPLFASAGADANSWALWRSCHRRLRAASNRGGDG